MALPNQKGKAIFRRLETVRTVCYDLYGHSFDTFQKEKKVIAYTKDLITGKNEKGVQKLLEEYELPDEDILVLSVSDEEDEFIFLHLELWAVEEFGIIFGDHEYGEIPNDAVDAFLEKIDDDKDKVPCLYEAKR